MRLSCVVGLLALLSSAAHGMMQQQEEGAHNKSSLWLPAQAAGHTSVWPQTTYEVYKEYLNTTFNRLTENVQWLSPSNRHRQFFTLNDEQFLTAFLHMGALSTYFLNLQAVQKNFDVLLEIEPVIV